MPTAPMSARFQRCEVAIIGDGVIGLSTAVELGRAGARCQVFGAARHEAASGAAAGLLAPSIGNLSTSVRPFFTASLARYPAFVDELRDYEPALALVEGLLDVSLEASGGHRDFGVGQRLTRYQTAQLEPAVSAPNGAVFHAQDSAVDNQLLVAALRRAIAARSGADTLHDDPIASIHLRGNLAVLRTRAGSVVESERVVLAAGAWSSTIAGLPRPVPVSPLKGQMLAVASTALRHAVMGDDIYLVPRPSEIAIGATAEHAGFDATVSPDAIETLRQAAIRICPSLGAAPVIRSWAGLRPATPDLLPILGPDPSEPKLLYACGHSKNGILLAPATALAIADLALGRPASFDLTPFRIDRFPAQTQPEIG